MLSNLAAHYVLVANTLEFSRQEREQMTFEGSRLDEIVNLTRTVKLRLKLCSRLRDYRYCVRPNCQKNRLCM